MWTFLCKILLEFLCVYCGFGTSHEYKQNRICSFELRVLQHDSLPYLMSDLMCWRAQLVCSELWPLHVTCKLRRLQCFNSFSGHPQRYEKLICFHSYTAITNETFVGSSGISTRTFGFLNRRSIHWAIESTGIDGESYPTNNQLCYPCK